jgi:calcineurin-like phosphoesterase family protein
MAEIFLIADTHFGHNKIFEFEKETRPFSTIQEHDETLIDNWNKVINKKDTVWHLGDVLFGSSNFQTLSRLKGIKKLVLGNHDSYPTKRYLEFFNNVYGSFELHDCLLTHIPIHDSELRHTKLNIHGHLHSKSLNDPRFFSVSCDVINLTPIAFEEILKTL